MTRLLFSLSIALFFPVMQYAKPVKMEIYAEVDQAVGNIAYTYKGELVYSNHPFYAPKIRVMHYDAKTKNNTLSKSCMEYT
ncbi:MAG: hypothetical protein LGB78_07485 [Sulfurovum sp.]|nr:hypothetical protein [Sulfurovum sp.]MCB4751008.1 hypothetical protein [Sulfurovum sp.]MCB4762091.1 hypothetical protein [Sulfurovum sp.]MCB4763729.1 hypothetical protein [Sulfurovum sp.]MCB4773555.1 hypothetical protein [Sulfurovum sp.]